MKRGVTVPQVVAQFQQKSWEEIVGSGKGRLDPYCHFFERGIPSLRTLAQAVWVAIQRQNSMKSHNLKPLNWVLDFYPEGGY
jgi:hypothetical protein